MEIIMTKKSTVGNLMLLVAAIIWGSAFVAQESGAQYVGAFTFNGLRFLIGGAVLIPAIRINNFKSKKKGTFAPMTKADWKALLFSGISCGVALALASYFQQWGLESTSAGKAGFITALYIMFVPIIGLFFKRKTPIAFWGCIVVAVIGFYFLCIHGDLSLDMGDALMLVCSILFSIHIILIDKFSHTCDGIKLSCVQFLTVGVICTILMFVFEQPSWENISKAAFSIAYTGIFSCGIAFTLQVLGQKRTHPAIATLIMSLESVFSLITGMIFNFSANVPTVREAIGSALIFAAVIAAQMLPQTSEKKTDNKESDYETR